MDEPWGLPSQPPPRLLNKNLPTCYWHQAGCPHHSMVPPVVSAGVLSSGTQELGLRWGGGRDEGGLKLWKAERDWVLQREAVPPDPGLLVALSKQQAHWAQLPTRQWPGRPGPGLEDCPPFWGALLRVESLEPCF